MPRNDKTFIAVAIGCLLAGAWPVLAAGVPPRPEPQLIALPRGSRRAPPAQIYASLATEASHQFRFRVVNQGRETIVITSWRTSCTCTTVQAPAGLWAIPPGADTVVAVDLNFPGRQGADCQSADLQTTAGSLHLAVEVDAPVGPLPERKGLHGGPAPSP